MHDPFRRSAASLFRGGGDNEADPDADGESDGEGEDRIWEAEEDSTLGHVWPEGGDLMRECVYVRSRPRSSLFVFAYAYVIDSTTPDDPSPYNNKHDAHTWPEGGGEQAVRVLCVWEGVGKVLRVGLGGFASFSG
jgi:hypothetical protein